LREAQAGREVGRYGREWGKRRQGILGDTPDIAKVLGKRGRYRANLVSDLLVCEGGLVVVRRRHAVERGGLISEIVIG